MTPESQPFCKWATGLVEMYPRYLKFGMNGPVQSIADTFLEVLVPNESLITSLKSKCP